MIKGRDHRHIIVIGKKNTKTGLIEYYNIECDDGICFITTPDGDKIDSCDYHMGHKNTSMCQKHK